MRVPSAIDRVWLIQRGFSTAAEWPRQNYRYLVIHDMEGGISAAIGEWNKGRAGAHVSITREGLVYLTCPLHLVAWHAGTDRYTGRVTRGVDFRFYNINPESCGLELEGFAFDGNGYTEAQYDGMARFGRWYRDTLGWPADPEHTWRHSEISNQRGDPGPRFDMDRFLADVAR